ncbi:MAG: ComF family protein [Clostridia bacterium]|nr:ComF family protein [Clostridia bacterium]
MRARILSFFFPKDAVCIGCGALRVDHIAWSLCSACAEGVTPLTPPFCPRCGMPGWAMVCPDCLAHAPDALDGRFSGYLYSDTVRKLVRALKYQSVGHAVEALADGMTRALPQERFDALIPVPLYRARQRARGFNQAMLLAAALSERTGIPVLDAMCRNRSTKTQTRLSRNNRMRNVQGAFDVMMNVRSRTLLLVDDMLTTGATALACAQALKAAGASRVILITAARADVSQDAD